MKTAQFYLLCGTMLLLTSVSCKKKYERPDQFSVDLFENERNEQPIKILTPEEAMNKSVLVIKTDSVKLINHLELEGKNINIYKINSGKIVKSANGIIRFPISVISNHNLKIEETKKDSVAVYLINPQSYKLLVKDMAIDYQTLPSKIFE